MKGFMRKINKSGVGFVLSASLLLSTPMHIFAVQQNSFFGVPTFFMGLTDKTLKFVGLRKEKSKLEKISDALKIQDIYQALKSTVATRKGKIITISGATLTVGGFIAVLLGYLFKKGKGGKGDNDGKPENGQTATNTTGDQSGTVEKDNKKQEITPANGQPAPAAGTPSVSDNAKSTTPAAPAAATTKTTEAKDGFFKSTWNKSVNFVKGIPSSIGNGFKAIGSGISTGARGTWSGVKYICGGIKNLVAYPINTIKSWLPMSKAAKPAVTPEVKPAVTTEVKPAVTTEVKPAVTTDAAPKADLPDAPKPVQVTPSDPVGSVEEIIKDNKANETPKIVAENPTPAPTVATNVEKSPEKVPVAPGNTAEKAKMFEKPAVNQQS